jgi:hypothetical protein
LKKGSEFWRLLTLYPKKKHIRVSLPLPQSEQIDSQLSDADIDWDYNLARGRYLVNLTPGNMPKQISVLPSLIKMAYDRSKDDGDVEEE